MDKSNSYVLVFMFPRLYKPPSTDDITSDRPDLGLDLLEIGKIERDIIEKETRDKDIAKDTEQVVKVKDYEVKEYRDDIIRPVGSVKQQQQLGCDITGALS